MKRLDLDKILLVLMGSLFLSGSLTAQDTIPMTFEMAVDLALNKNLEYRIQENNLAILRGRDRRDQCDQRDPQR
jgi:outer membrane protein